MSPTQQLLETMATEPDLPTVLQKCRLTLEEAYALLNSHGEAPPPPPDSIVVGFKHQARIHCENKSPTATPPKPSTNSPTVATTITDAVAAKPEVQLKSIHALLRALNLDNLPFKHSHHALPKPKPPASPRTPPAPPPHPTSSSSNKPSRKPPKKSPPSTSPKTPTPSPPLKLRPPIDPSRGYT